MLLNSDEMLHLFFGELLGRLADLRAQSRGRVRKPTFLRRSRKARVGAIVSEAGHSGKPAAVDGKSTITLTGTW